MTDKELSQRAKDYFAQIRKTDRLIQRLTDTVHTLRSGLTSQSYELKPDKVQTSGAKDTLGETIVKIMSLEEDINARIDKLVDMKKDAFNRIGNVSDKDQQNILIARYVNGENGKRLLLNLVFQSHKFTVFMGPLCLISQKKTPIF